MTRIAHFSLTSELTMLARTLKSHDEGGGGNGE
jgi:hypothetical protein